MRYFCLDHTRSLLYHLTATRGKFVLLADILLLSLRSTKHPDFKISLPIPPKNAKSYTKIHRLTGKLHIQNVCSLRAATVSEKIITKYNTPLMSESKKIKIQKSLKKLYYYTFILYNILIINTLYNINRVKRCNFLYNY